VTYKWTEEIPTDDKERSVDSVVQRTTARCVCQLPTTTQRSSNQTHVLSDAVLS